MTIDPTGRSAPIQMPPTAPPTASGLNQNEIQWAMELQERVQKGYQPTPQECDRYMAIAAQYQASGPQTAPAPQETPKLSPEEKVNVSPLAGSATAPMVNLVDSPSRDREALFTETFGKKSTNSLNPNDPTLLKKLTAYHHKVSQSHDMKVQIGRNPRGLDFMYALEKAATNKALNRDDIQSIQLFIAKDTKYGPELAYPGEETGTDGKYGFRTHAALDRLIYHFQPSDLVPDPYYQRLDREGIPYAKFKE